MGKLRELVVSAAMEQELLRLGTSISQPKGSFLFHCGGPPRGLFLIRSGRVCLSMDGEVVAFEPRILGPGSVAGLPATVAGSPYSLTAEVIEDAELTFVAREVMLQCLQENQQLCFEVMDLLSGEISGARAAFKQSSVHRPRKAQ